MLASAIVVRARVVVTPPAIVCSVIVITARATSTTTVVGVIALPLIPERIRIHVFCLLLLLLLILKNSGIYIIAEVIRKWRKIAYEFFIILSDLILAEIGFPSRFWVRRKFQALNVFSSSLKLIK